MILAAAQVCYMPTAMALITDFHGKETQGKATGIFQSGCYVGIFLAGLPAAYAATHLGWRAMFCFSGVLGLCDAALMLALPNEKAGPPGIRSVGGPTQRTSIREAISLFRKPSILAIMVGFALFGGASWIVVTYLPLFIYEHYRLSLESAAFQATFFMQVTAMAADPVLGHVADRWSSRNIRNRFYFCALAGFAGLPALVAVGLGSHTTSLIAGLVLFGMVAAGTDVSWMPILTLVTSKYQRATAFGYLNMASCLAGGASALLAAMMMKKLGLGTVIASGGGLLFLLGLGLLAFPHTFLRRDFISEDQNLEVSDSVT